MKDNETIRENSKKIMSDEHLYIGVQMHRDGYLFETIDGGNNWNVMVSIPYTSQMLSCQHGNK